MNGKKRNFVSTEKKKKKKIVKSPHRVPRHSVEKRNEKFSLTEKKFRQINYLVISLVKPLLSRNFCEKSVRENLCNFHTVHRGKMKHLLSLKKKKFVKSAI